MNSFRLVTSLVVGLLALSPPVLAQTSYSLYGNARSDALGNSTTALPSAVGVHANPAFRATLNRSTTLFYARESFGLSVLRYGASHVALPFDWGTVSSGLSTIGFEEYRETHVNLGYARGFSLGTSRSMYAGMTGRYHHASIAGYGSAGTVVFNVGLGMALLRSLHLGVHATNLRGATLVTDEPLPRTLALGLHYRAHRTVHLLADVFKDVRFPPSLRGGVEVQPVPPLSLRVGVTTAPIRFTGGAGIRLGPLNAHVAAEQHQELGWSPSASLRIRW